MDRSSSIRKLVVAGALSAVSIVLGLTPMGYIPWFSGASISVLAVPVVIGAVLEGPVVGTFIGAIFGATSLFQAYTNPAKGPFDFLFMNPVVSILPRLFIGLVAWAIYRAFRGKIVPVASAVAGVAGALTNSVLVLGVLVLMGALQPPVALAVLLSNGILEAAAAAVLSSAVVGAWKGIASRRGKSRLAEEK